MVDARGIITAPTRVAGPAARDILPAGGNRRQSEVGRRPRVHTVTRNVHLETASSWEDAEALVAFRPVEPKQTEGFDLQSLAVHVRDHRQREVAVEDRTLEAHYGGFVLTQSRRTEDEARRLAVDVSYGRAPYEARIAGREARVYEMGPEPEPDDIDGRMPAVVVWHDGDRFFLIASNELATDALIRIAGSLY